MHRAGRSPTTVNSELLLDLAFTCATPSDGSPASVCKQLLLNTLEVAIFPQREKKKTQKKMN
jgi:hypothetical protein